MTLHRERTARLAFDELEPRLLLAVSAAEQYFIYRLNLARHDPQAYQQDANLPISLAGVQARPPLALNAALDSSAEFKANEMATGDYFAHRSEVTGIWPNKLLRDHGYPLPDRLRVGEVFYLFPDDGNSVESIAAGYTSAAAAMDGLIVDEGIDPPGHRQHLLGMTTLPAVAREIGVGYALNANSHYRDYWAIHLTASNTTQSFLTGVAFADGNGNLRYDQGEGLGGVTIAAGSQQTTTNAAGGWSLPVAAGQHTVTASGGALSGSSSASVLVGNENVEVDFISGLPRAYVNFETVLPPLLIGTTLDITGTAAADTIAVTMGANVVVTLNGANYTYPAVDVATINVRGLGGSDKLTFSGTAGNETLDLRPGSLDVAGPLYTLHAESIETLHVNSGGGADDQAVLYDSAGNDIFASRPTFAYITGPGFYNYVNSFDRVSAYANSGDAGGLGDRAFLYDSPGNDTFAGRPTFSYLSGTGHYNYVSTFDRVFAYANAGDAGGTGDQAYLYDSAGNDTFAARPTNAYLTGAGFYNYTNSFDRVYAYATAGDTGGAGDQAYLYDSAGNDTFAARPTFAYMTGTGFYNYVNAFDRVFAYATAGGTTDQAYLYDSAGNDTYAARPTYASLAGPGYYNYANSFDRVYAYATAGDAGGTGDQAYLYDSATNDLFYGRDNYGWLTGTGFYNYFTRFRRAAAFANSGGTDTLNIQSLDYIFSQVGTWENVV